MLNFGKYNGLTYDYVLANQKEYCIWILKQSTINMDKRIFQFYEYIKQNIYKLYNISNLTGLSKIPCTVLVNYIICDNNFTDKLMNIKIQEKKLGYSIKPNNQYAYYGQFVDYLVIYEIAKKYNIPFSDDRTKYILLHNNGDNYGEIIKTSYHNMTNKIATICDIFNVSLCHSLFFDDDNAMSMINKFEPFYDKLSYDNIIKYINNINSKNIILNPILTNYELGIIADGDIIMDNIIIDIKVSNSIGLHIYDFIQLIIYAILYYANTGIICNKLVILNFLKGCEYEIDVSDQLLLQFFNIVRGYKI